MRSLASLLVLGLGSTAYADEPAPPCKPEVDVKRATITICVKTPAPGVAFVPASKSINYEWEELKQDFLPKTIRSVEKAPF